MLSNILFLHFWMDDCSESLFYFVFVHGTIFCMADAMEAAILIFRWLVNETSFCVRVISATFCSYVTVFVGP